MKVPNEEIMLTLDSINQTLFVNGILLDTLLKNKIIQGMSEEMRVVKATKYTIRVNPTSVTSIDILGRQLKIKTLYKLKDDNSIRVDRWEDVMK